MQSEAKTHRARELTDILVSWPSVTGTADEASFPLKLAELLLKTPYFKNHPDDLLLAPIPGDPLGRSTFWRLSGVAGAGPFSLQAISMSCLRTITVIWPVSLARQMHCGPA